MDSTMPAVLLHFRDPTLRDEVATALARAGVLPLVRDDTTALLGRLRERNGIGMVLAETGEGLNPDVFVATVKAAAKPADVVVAFMSDDDIFLGPAESPVYCAEDFQSYPQQFVDAVRARLLEAADQAWKGHVGALAVSTNSTVLALKEALTAAMDPLNENGLVTRRAMESRLEGRTLVPAVMADWASNKDPILWKLLALAGTALLGLGAILYADVNEQMGHARGVPELRDRQTKVEVRVEKLEKRRSVEPSRVVTR